MEDAARKKSDAGSPNDISERLAICPYCGCGCRLKLVAGSNKDSAAVSRIEKTLPDTSDTVSQGRPCIKGLNVHEMLNNARLTSPMIRKNKSSELEECSWEEAYDLISLNLNKIEDQIGNGGKGLKDAVYFIGSGETTNESNYLLSKLCRNHFHSNNIDSCARLCHAATGVGFDLLFGIKAIPKYSFEDIDDADGFLFVGTDPLEDYPVMFNRVLAAKRSNAKVAVVDVAASGTSGQSDLFLKITPEGILPMLCHLITKLVKGGDMSRDAKWYLGYEDFIKSARDVSRNNPLSTFGFSRDDMENLYWHVNNSKKLVIGFGMGLTQHENGVENVLAISGLSVLLDAVLFPGRGKVNVQGAGDVGADPSWRPRSEAGGIGEWDFGFASHDGLPMTEALYSSDVKFVWVMCGNPSQSMPDLNTLDKSFGKKFIVYQHNHPSRTMEFADVVLPCAVVSEVEGCVTNAERRVRGVTTRISEDDGSSRKNSMGGRLDPSSQIVAFAQKLGAKGFNFKSKKEIFDEMIKVVPEYESLNYEKVFSDRGQFADKEPKFYKLPKLKYDVTHFEGKGDYPFALTTARNRYHFCTGDGTRNSETLSRLAGEPCVLMNPQDCEDLGIDDGAEVKLVSTVGEINVVVRQDASVNKRMVVAPFHFEKLLVNRLTPKELDPISKTPCYKNVSVRVEVE